MISADSTGQGVGRQVLRCQLGLPTEHLSPDT